MRALVRLGDESYGYCDKHEGWFYGYIISCSDTVFLNDRGSARVGDLVRSKCGCTSYIVSSSGEVITNDRGQARLGDLVRGSSYNGTLVSSSGNIFGNT